MAKIWIIEDDRNLAALIGMALSKEGHDVIVFHEASKALDETKINTPHLILMDIALPGMDGAEAVRVLRRNFRLKNIPVIFLTGLVAQTDLSVEQTGIFIDGVNYKVLGKPFAIEHLLKMARAILSGHQE